MNRFLFALILLFFVSCGDSTKKTKVKSNDTKTNDPVDVKTSPEVQMIDDQSVPYPSDSIPYILEKAGLCMCDTAEARKNQFAPCESSYFRYFKNSNEPYSNGFLVEVRPLILGTKTYRIVNIVRDEE